jgi:hypothetical protein
MADMMYRLVLRAQFENQAEFTKATDALDKLQISGAKVTVTMGGMGKTSSESMTGFARGVMSLGFMFNMMESALMRQEMATMMAENAQNRLNDAIAHYGVNSEQARRASKQMESELSYLNNANIRAYVSMGLMATTLLLQSKVLESATRAEIMHTAAKYGGAIASGTKTVAEHLETAAIWLKNAATTAWITLQAIAHPWLVPAMVAGAAAIAITLATVPSKQEGGYISETKPYLLHAGERVLSSKEVNTFKSLETGGLIEKEGLYHLHSGEKVLSKESVKTNEVFLASIKERLEKQNTQTEATSFLSSFKESSLQERTFNTNNVENNKATEKMIVNSLLSATKEANMKNIEKSALTERFMPSVQSGRTSLLGRDSVMPSGGGTTLPTFNFETHLHIETDLDAALEEQNRRIKNEYRRNAS